MSGVAWRILAGGLAMAFTAAGASRTDELPSGEPVEMGFSAERLDFMDRYYTEKVKKREIAGIVFLVARHGKAAHFSAIGTDRSPWRFACFVT